MLFITGGDPYSTNVEAISQLLGSYSPSGPIVLAVSRFHFEQQCQELGHLVPNIQWIEPIEIFGLSGASGDSKNLRTFAVDVGRKQLERSAALLSPVERGEIAIKALNMVPRSTSFPLAVITGPIDKAACAAAGFQYVGQTEFFQALWDHPAIMVLAGPQLKVGLVTNHLPLCDVAGSLSQELVTQKAKLLHAALVEEFGIHEPRIAVCGLNPHAGDQGLLGSEEPRIIRPAVCDLQASGMNIDGPFPADTVFYRAYQGGYDGVLAMYHDQGLGPLKLVHFDTAVNLSGGLPHMRVSPDHGPAKDLYLKKQMSVVSWQRSFELAWTYLERHR